MTARATADRTVPQLLVARARERPDGLVFRHKQKGIWDRITWSQYLDQTRLAALGLDRLGVERGDRVAIHSENRPEWVYGDVGAEALGAIVVGVYPTSPSPEVAHLLRDSGARILIAEDQEQVDKALDVDDVELEKIVVIDPRGLRRYDDPRLMTWEALLELGADAHRSDPSQFEQLVESGAPDDPAVIVYTSGTTGPPKGAVLTHRNGLDAAIGFGHGIGVVDGGEVTVSYLPLCHLAERVWTIYAPLLFSAQVNFAESVATVERDIFDIAPTFFGAVPRVADRMRSRAERLIRDSNPIKRWNYGVWMRVGRRLARERLDNDGRLSLSSRLQFAIGEQLLYRPLRTQLGLRNVRHYLVGTAPVAPDLMEWFHAIGLRMFQTYGQTECGGASHAHRGFDIRFETVGLPFDGVECRIDESTDEVLLRGDGVFVGYWNNAAATAETVDAHGWLHTGDAGVIDDDGHLRIVGRIKDIIITDGGKNISPSEIENAVAASEYVQEAVVVGDGRKYLTALVGIDYDAVSHWAERQGHTFTTYGDLAANPAVVELIGDHVQRVNSGLAQVETLKQFRLFPKQLDHDDAELTATQKVRRSTIEARYGELIQEMYS